MPRPRLPRLVVLLALLLGAAGAGAWWWQHRNRVAPLHSAPIFADDFDGAPQNPLTRSNLDPLKWKLTGPEQILQRTQWGLAPELRKEVDGTSFVRIPLDTFNPRPEKAGRFLLSTQITSLDRWKVENGVEYEARLRAERLPPGLILGFFAYGDAGAWKNTYQKTEADFELLTLQGGHHVWTHIWDNWNPLRLGSNDGSLWRAGGANWNGGGWNTFKIRWYPGKTQWIVNDRLVREEKRVRPGSPMGVWFNLWAPNPDWTDAYAPDVAAAPTLRKNRRYFYDVDYVRVRRITPTPGQSVVGQGEGLQGSYFSTPDLRGQPLLRLDPRVDFDWGDFSPAPGLGKNGFSVRWDGFVQARTGGLYTFTVRSDDGARLWVDGKKLIDHWRVQGNASHQGQIELSAGRRTPIRLEIFNLRGNAAAQLAWSSAQTPFEIVPQSQLYVAARPAPPRFSLASQILTGPRDIKIESSTPGATIRYTLDGGVPTPSSHPLPPDGMLHVSYTSLIRAGAFAPGQVPGESARAFYVLDDRAPPRLAISPLPARLKRIGAVWGLVEDGGSGVARVDLVITRLSDGLKWKEGAWVKQEWGIGAKILGPRWSVQAGLPAAQNLQPGRYELKAVAYDIAGNIKGARQTIAVERASKPVMPTSTSPKR